MFYNIFVVHVVNVSEYKILCSGTNPQKYQTLVPAKNSHLKVELDSQDEGCFNRLNTWVWEEPKKKTK